MNRRTFLCGLILGTLSAPLAAEAQAGKVPRIGLLTGTTSPESPLWGAFREQLHEFGYVEGQNIALEWRATGGRAERASDLIAELVRLKVDVLVVIDNPSIVAAQKATSTIPIVMVLSTDPVGTGFVASLPRPGGNTTGLTAMTIPEKALQLLKEAVPTGSRVAVLWDPTEPARRRLAKEAEVAARALGLQSQLVEARSATELDSVFAAMARERIDAVLVQPSQMIYAHRARIADLAAKRRLPTMCWRRETVEAGCLMGHAASYIDLFRRAAYFVDKILRGAKPADLPVEQSTKFELSINMKTARALGLTIPPSLLLRADHVID